MYSSKVTVWRLLRHSRLMDFHLGRHDPVFPLVGALMLLSINFVGVVSDT